MPGFQGQQRPHEEELPQESSRKQSHTARCQTQLAWKVELVEQKIKLQRRFAVTESGA